MGATDLLCHLRGAGLVLTLTPVGGLRVAPRSALTDDHRAVIRAERDALVLALHAENSRSRLPENIDPDRCCWPHTQAMNTDEIDLFAGRLPRWLCRHREGKRLILDTVCGLQVSCDLRDQPR